MSSLYVRQLFEGWLQDPAMTVPYYPTVNMEQNPIDDLWMTAEFGSSYRDVVTVCSNQEIEEGEVEVLFFGLPGQGYTAVLTALETNIGILMSRTDPNNKLTILRRSGPVEYTRGDAENFYIASCFIDYNLYE